MQYEFIIIWQAGINISQLLIKNTLFSGAYKLGKSNHLGWFFFHVGSVLGWLLEHYSYIRATISRKETWGKSQWLAKVKKNILTTYLQYPRSNETQKSEKDFLGGIDSLAITSNLTFFPLPCTLLFYLSSVLSVPSLWLLVLVFFFSVPHSSDSSLTLLYPVPLPTISHQLQVSLIIPISLQPCFPHQLLMLVSSKVPVPVLSAFLPTQVSSLLVQPVSVFHLNS